MRVGGEVLHVHLPVEQAACIPEPGAGEALDMCPATRDGLFGRYVASGEDDPGQYDQSPAWRPTEIPLGDDRTLVLDPT